MASERKEQQRALARYKVLTLVEKRQVLQCIEDGMPYKEIKRRYEIGLATICDIKKKEE